MWQTILTESASFFQTVPFLVIMSAVVLLISLLVSRRSVARIHALEKQLKQARGDLRALTTASVGVGGRVLELERRLRRLAEKQKEVDLYDSANQSYDHAIDLARQGAKIDDMVKSCGISRNEAELIQMMHRFKQAG
jgi:hypothetical protein